MLTAKQIRDANRHKGAIENGRSTKLSPEVKTASSKVASDVHCFLVVKIDSKTGEKSFTFEK